MTIWSRGTSQSEHQGCDMKEINAVGFFFLSQCYFMVSLSQEPSLSLTKTNTAIRIQVLLSQIPKLYDTDLVVGY